MEMDKYSLPVFLPEKEFSSKTILIKAEINDVGKEVGQILYQEEQSDPLPFHLPSAIAEEIFCGLVHIEYLRMGIGQEESNLNRIEKVGPVLKHLYHGTLLSYLSMTVLQGVDILDACRPYPERIEGEEPHSICPILFRRLEKSTFTFGLP